MSERTYNQFAIRIKRPHLVLLGAGASHAAFPNGEKNGLKLPLMTDFVETVDGLSDCFNKCGIDYRGRNFEDLYSDLYEDSKHDEFRQMIEELIYDYFARMELPDEPTLYDHLVLSLTERDVIATFNWDPFLWQAWCRNGDRVGEKNLPHILFLHGNTAIGICTRHDEIRIGHKECLCSQCMRPFHKSKLLYPIKKKSYDADPLIKSSWNTIKNELENAFVFTIFGYSAPSSDKEAVSLLQRGWGNLDQRSLEEIELIDIIDEDTLCKRWEKFIHSHHHQSHTDFYSSLIGTCSRRSTDAFWGASIDLISWEEHPIPKDASWDELDEWLKPYIEEEYRAKQMHTHSAQKKRYNQTELDP